jgi:hypothetical protein
MTVVDDVQWRQVHAVIDVMTAIDDVWWGWVRAAINLVTVTGVEFLMTVIGDVRWGRAWWGQVCAAI